RARAEAVAVFVMSTSALTVETQCMMSLGARTFTTLGRRVRDASAVNSPTLAGVDEAVKTLAPRSSQRRVSSGKNASRVSPTLVSSAILMTVDPSGSDPVLLPPCYQTRRLARRRHMPPQLLALQLSSFEAQLTRRLIVLQIR